MSKTQRSWYLRIGIAVLGAFLHGNTGATAGDVQNKSELVSFRIQFIHGSTLDAPISDLDDVNYFVGKRVGSGDSVRGRTEHSAGGGRRRKGDELAMTPLAQSDHGVFGSVALPFRTLPMADRWKMILADNGEVLLKQDCRSSDSCRGSLIGKLSATVDVAAKLPLQARLQLINSTVNAAITYRSDRRAYGKIDHWASFTEIVERSAGDCEDYAIMKMWLLKAAGVPPQAMQLTVLRDVNRGRYHAVLAVNESGEAFILDNAQDRVHRDRQLSTYVPIFSLGWQNAWIHGFRSRSAAVVEGPLNSIHPGEPASRPVAHQMVHHASSTSAVRTAAR
ncbi:MAG TPA: transglutaminase-like cysteine peptidase [Afifellaceae bacterium]|nr:transglutaminase-like cysteine peptidase [Afifellaceae bacterium]